MADTAAAPLLTSHKTRPAKAPSIDDTIETYMGATGALQLLKAVLLAFAWAFDAQQVFISVFTDAEPRWHCTGADASCSAATASPCALPSGAWAWDRPAVTSVISEWSLKCAGPALVSLPASSFFAGCLAGGFLLTTLADSLLGRRKMLLVSIVSMSVAGVLTAFSPNVWVYAALRFMSGFGRSMVGTCTLVLSTELVGKRWRDTVCVAGFFCFTLGFLSLPALAYTFREESWRNMYLWTSVPSLCYSILFYFLVQESPRWLLVRGRKQDAIETLQQIASLNGNSITSSFSMLHACTMNNDTAGESSGDSVFATLHSMWERPWALRRLAAIMTASFGVGMVYYGMPLNVGNLGSNLYLSVTYNALAELPSSILSWLLMGRINRRSSVIGLTGAAGVWSLACVIIPQGGARMAAELLSFFATCTAFNVIMMYSIELFPTSVRNSAVGLVRQALVLGGVAAPVLVALGRERSFLSFGVFGLVVGCFGMFAACLPETRGKGMSDTMDEEEHKEATVAACTVNDADCNSGLV
ncbi:Solute carrier family 22 member 3 [Hordeum vulgare]|uniref:H(+)/Pi cotransporter n=1 Tax=Hordeum vulgare subsp. vulgare TaxID=112509 RepID=A0A8I7B2L1_HORVV|nr:organic cation/carnitine transporter 2-like [Hordeum vulgare subsp. vulgare]KAE8808120.1 Solute carrier family 22 member 3 [Hordeum vulgare]